MPILLADEETAGIAHDIFGSSGVTIVDKLREYQERVKKAQLKKVVEHLGKNGGLFVDRFDKKRFQMDYNVWQALLKEVEKDG